LQTAKPVRWRRSRAGRNKTPCGCLAPGRSLPRFPMLVTWTWRPCQSQFARWRACDSGKDHRLRSFRRVLRTYDPADSSGKCRTFDVLVARIGDGMLDAAGLEVLDTAECLDLLASVSIGRVIFTARALPDVVRVNFVLHEGMIVVPTTGGSKLFAAVRNAVVAFEVDDFDTESQLGTLRSKGSPCTARRSRIRASTTWQPRSLAITGLRSSS